MPKIFISYRRDDCQGTADFLYSLLEDHFDAENVFFDVDSIDPGRNYVEYLDEQVSQCNVLLALIGKRWITAEDNDGEMRLFDENDFVRKEISSAMDQGITVIPLLVERADIPKKEMLPEALHKLCDQQATHVRPSPDFKKDVVKLIKDLERIELAKDKSPPDEKIIELRVRNELNKPTGKLTAAHFEEVKQLELDDQQITDIPTLAKLKQLEVLYLGKNKLTDVSALVDLKYLKELYLQENELNDIDTLAGLKQLERLNLKRNKLNDVSALAGLKRLTKLSLSSNKITDVSALAALTQLEYLNLRDNRINDVCALAGLDNLKILYLSNNKLTDVRALASITQINELYLGGNNIRNISALSELTHLEKLTLRNNRITDARPLAGLKQLTVLTLQGTQLSEVELDSLRKALPDCKILPTAL